MIDYRWSGGSLVAGRVMTVRGEPWRLAWPCTTIRCSPGIPDAPGFWGARGGVQPRLSSVGQLSLRPTPFGAARRQSDAFPLILRCRAPSVAASWKEDSTMLRKATALLAAGGVRRARPGDDQTNNPETLAERSQANGARGARSCGDRHRRRRGAALDRGRASAARRRDLAAAADADRLRRRSKPARSRKRCCSI